MIEDVLLLSGGVDSTTLAYSEQPDLAITVDYGQICAEAEIRAASQICEELDLDHTVINVDCSDLGSGSMSEDEQLQIASTPEWWPFRNQLIITLAAMDAIQRDADTLILGSVKSDQQHADGKPKFYELIDDLLSFQEGSLNVSTPAADQTTTQLVQNADVPLSLLGWTHSCHTSNTACGKCRGCIKRHRVLNEAFDGRA